MKFHEHIFIIYACCALLQTPGVSQEHFTTHKQLKRSDVSVKVITIKNWTREVCSHVTVGCPVPREALQSYSCFIVMFEATDSSRCYWENTNIPGFWWTQRQCFDLKACCVSLWIPMEACIWCTNKSMCIIQWGSKHIVLRNLISHHFWCKCVHISGIISGLSYCEGDSVRFSVCVCIYV